MIDTKAVAKFIFDRHAEGMQCERADRVAFMVKGANGEERKAGGLCESALADWIEDAIAAQSSEDSGS